MTDSALPTQPTPALPKSSSGTNPKAYFLIFSTSYLFLPRASSSVLMPPLSPSSFLLRWGRSKAYDTERYDHTMLKKKVAGLISAEKKLSDCCKLHPNESLLKDAFTMRASVFLRAAACDQNVHVCSPPSPSHRPVSCDSAKPSWSINLHGLLVRSPYLWF